MKKLRILASILFVFALLSVFVTVSSASTPNYVVNITSDKANGVIKEGEQVKLSITVTDINTEVVSGGIRSAEFCLSYNTDMFEYVSAAGGNGANGSDSYNGATFMAELYSADDGIVKLLMLPAFSSTEVLVTEDNVICFTVVLKAKTQTAVLESDVKIIDDQEYDSLVVCSSNVGNGESFDGDYKSVAFKLLQTLPAPDGLAFSDDYKASWNTVANADKYLVQLYKDGEKLGNEYTVTSNTLDLSTVIKENFGGVYSFSVVAVSNSDAYADSDSAKLPESASVKYRGKLYTPKIELTTDKIKGTIDFKITDNNLDDTVSIYIVTVYERDGKELDCSVETTSLTGTINDLIVGKEYDITVKAVALPSEGDNSVGNDDSDESEKKTIKADGITGITVKTKPKLSYTEGDMLDLSAMEITVEFAVSNSVTVKKDKFATYGIVVSPKDGADVLLSMNGKSLVVTCGEHEADADLTLSVESGVCSHPNTEPEHQDPTCGVDGYDREKCTLCGVVVEQTIIPATGDHEFSDWEWISKPTISLDGVRRRSCPKCLKQETDQVTYAEYLEMNSSNTSGADTSIPDETDPPATTPEDTEPVRKNDALGGLGDIGKLFLIALIVILFIIIFFVILAVWLESRRNKRRKSRARTNRVRTTSGSAPQRTNNTYRGQTPRGGNTQRRH